ncbi:MAG: heme NO-binding domain-containing protein [Shimia sp.]
MHGLINRAVQCFVSDTYGPHVWEGVARDADLNPAGFEALLEYEDEITFRMLDAVQARLSKPRAEVLEDIGIYLVSGAKIEAPRRLLRFGGQTFADFVASLGELPDRARLALPNLFFPSISVREAEDGVVMLTCNQSWQGFSAVLTGVLRAMADDYGALAFIDEVEEGRIQVTLFDETFTEGRDFALAREAS